MPSKNTCTLYYGAYITPTQLQKVITYICQNKILSDDIEEHIKYMNGTYNKSLCDETESEEIAEYIKEFQKYTKTIDWFNKNIFINTFTIYDTIKQLKASDKPEFIPESVFSYIINLFNIDVNGPRYEYEYKFWFQDGSNSLLFIGYKLQEITYGKRYNMLGSNGVGYESEFEDSELHNDLEVIKPKFGYYLIQHKDT